MRSGRLSKKKCYPFLNYILLRYAAKKKETINVIYCARVFMKRVHTRCSTSHQRALPRRRRTTIKIKLHKIHESTQ